MSEARRDGVWRRAWPVAALAALLALGTVALFRAGAGPTRHIVEIRGFAFQPAVLEVAAGDTVVWVNRDMVPHTATAADDAGWDTGRLDEGEQGHIVVSGSGEQPYLCDFHPSMTGTLVVR